MARLAHLGVVGAFLVIATGAHGVDVFQPVSVTDGVAKDYELQAGQDPIFARTRLVKVGLDPFYGLNPDWIADAPGQPIVLNMFDDATAILDPYKVESKSFSHFLVYGRLEGFPDSHVLLLIDGDLVAGTVRWPGVGLFEIRYGGGGVHAVHEVNPSYVATCVVNLSGGISPESIEESSEKQTTTLVDLLAIYTPGARLQAAPFGGIENSIELAVAETNVAYENSLVNHRLRLVRAQEVDYVETTRDDALEDITNPDDGFIDGVHDLRDEVGADVVSFFIDRGDGGLGWQMSSATASFENLAFNVVDQRVAASFLVLAHEVGHNMGAAHERRTGSNGVFNYSHALVTDTFSTVMNAVSDSETIQHFSNPNVTNPANDEPTGIPSNQLRSADNARTLNATSGVVSQFRDRSFDVLPMNQEALAAGGRVTFSVSYTGPSSVLWEATVLGGASWISFPISSSGSNSGSFAVDAAENTSGIERAGTIEVTASGALSAVVEVTVTQPACDPPSPPTNVSATDGTVMGAVQITWSPVSGATGYRVYRSASPNGGFAAISSFIADTTFDDTSAPPPTSRLPGCAPVAQPTIVYYAVTAIDACAEGDRSAINSGYNDAPPQGSAHILPTTQPPTNGMWPLVAACLALIFWRPRRSQPRYTFTAS